MEEDTLVIRRLNDEFRRTGIGGRFMVTGGIQAMGPEAVQEILIAVQSFTDFKTGNDPYGEHDFGAFTVKGKRIFWKIDYYDLEVTARSPDPADPEVTVRVMTVMLAEEY